MPDSDQMLLAKPSIPRSPNGSSAWEPCKLRHTCPQERRLGLQSCRGMDVHSAPSGCRFGSPGTSREISGKGGCDEASAKLLSFSTTVETFRFAVQLQSTEALSPRSLTILSFCLRWPTDWRPGGHGQPRSKAQLQGWCGWGLGQVVLPHTPTAVLDREALRPGCFRT